MIGMPHLVFPVLPAGSLARFEQPVLTGAGLVLRPWRAEDAPAVAAAYEDPAIQLWHARSLSLDEAADWIGQWPRRWQAENGAG
jgi:RimJ/RimL family protein N-acetyltransferase